MIKKNDICEIEICGVTDEGSGVGKVDGFALFIPDTAVGDLCKVLVIKVNKSYGFGKLLSIIKPSTDRVEIDCAVFNKCGGCSLRHISYEAELQLKHDMVANAFKRIGEIETPLSPIIGDDQINHYRNKAQYPFAKDEDGKACCGFFAKRSHRVIPVKSCLLQPDFFSDIVSDVLDFINKNEISIYDEKTQSGLLRHLYLRFAETTNSLMLCFIATSFNIPKLSEFINFIILRYPIIKSIVLNKNPKNTNVILGDDCKTVFGSDTITDTLCGVKITLSPLSFYQVNRCQAEKLYSKAIEYSSLLGDEVLLDLYCGAGTIGLSAANKVKKIIGVEIIPEAIENAKENAKLNRINNSEFICSDAGTAAKNLANRGINPDVIIVDPPRKGLDEVVIDAIATMSPKKLVMISCNPSTAARDCKLLKAHGYEVKAITPVDMFARTGHVESVVLMSKVEGKAQTNMTWFRL